MKRRSRLSKPDYQLDLDTHAEIRQAFSYLDSLAPPSPDLPEATNLASFKPKQKTRQRVIYTAAASVAAVALAGGLFATNTYESATRSTDLTSTNDTSSTAPIQDPSVPEPLLDSTYTNIHRDSFGELWGINSGIDDENEHDGAIGRSTDGGKTWSIILVPEQNERWHVLDVSPEDEVRVAAIEVNIDGGNFTETGDITLRTFDRTDDSWSAEVLPILQLPADAQAIPETGSDECERFGLENVVRPLDIAATGDTVLVLGQQSILAQGSCDVTTNVLWTSTGGSWSAGPVDLPGGYASGLSALEGSFVAYGSSARLNATDPDREFRLWSSADGTIWEQQPLELPELPPFAVTPGGDDTARPGQRQSIEAVQSDNGLILWVAVGVTRTIDTSIKDSSELKKILDTPSEEGRPGGIPLAEIDEQLENLGIDFPLDAREVERLRGFYPLESPAGGLVLTNDADRGWVGERRE